MGSNRERPSSIMLAQCSREEVHINDEEDSSYIDNQGIEKNAIIGYDPSNFEISESTSLHRADARVP